MLPKPFHEFSITLVPKSDKNITRKEKYRQIYFMNMNVKF